MYIIQGTSIKGIDIGSRTFVKEWNIGQIVLSFDALLTRNGSTLIVAATAINKEQSLLCSFSDLC